MAKVESKKAKSTVNDANKVKKTKKKAAKDPNAPKRGMTAYLFFANAKREEVAEANKELSFGERNKLMGKMWREMSAEDKAPYEDKAKADKERYENEKKEYTANGGAKAKKEEPKEEDEDDEDSGSE